MSSKLNKLIKEPSRIVVILLIPVLTIIYFSHHKWVNPHTVIDWDIKSYYAYLPATIIHKDLSLGFIDDNPSEYNKWFWPSRTEDGKRYIVTSMGMSFVYSPFFFIAHAIAHLTDYSTDGYSVPYAFALWFSSLFYLFFGFWFLAKLLRKYFNELTTIITITVIYVGTNLYYFSGWNAAMPHSFNFSLIAIFIYLTDKWHEKISYKRTILLGLLAGLISLIRPTNVLVLLILFLWNTRTLSDITARTKLFINNYKHVILMMCLFTLVWIPQFIYWKFVSGQFFFNSYSGISGKFFWGNPQIANILFSFRKGWYIYTPIMFIATLSIILMFRNKKPQALAVGLFVLINIYVQASWWCWWFGGSFGLRAFIDSYSIMALPLATLIAFSLEKWKRGIPVLVLIGVLSWYNTFQTKQYNRMAVHWWWMSRTAYSHTFLKLYTPGYYWDAIPTPDYPKARMGVYVSENLITRTEGYKNLKVLPNEILQLVKADIPIKKRHKKLAEKYDISIDSAITIDAFNRYEKKWSIDKYVRPIIASKLVDSLSKDTLFLRHNIRGFRALSPEELNAQLTLKANEELKNIKF